MLFDYLREHYKPGEPIFTEDIHIKGVNRPNLIQQLKTLTDNKKVGRFEKGIYYIPRETVFNTLSGPIPETVAIYKYISRKGKINGYYSGNTFANLIGISMQMPMKKEIVSNNIAAIVRKVSIGKQKFIVRRSNIKITNENVHVLQLLELLKKLDNYLDGDYDTAREKIKKYAALTKITKADIDKYIRQFPDSTFRYYYELRLDNVLA